MFARLAQIEHAIASCDVSGVRVRWEDVEAQVYAIAVARREIIAEDWQKRALARRNGADEATLQQLAEAQRADHDASRVADRLRLDDARAAWVHAQDQLRA